MKNLSLVCFIILSACSLLKAQPVPYSFQLPQQGFIENKGQVHDQNGRPNGNVKFIFSDKFFNLQLKENSFSYEIFQAVKSDNHFAEYGKEKNDNDGVTDLLNDHSELHSQRIDVRLIGANPNPEIIINQPTGIKYNFYISGLSDDGITSAESFDQVTYKNIYPLIDLVFSTPDEDNETLLKYEWILHPGSDAAKIKLQYSGATALIPITNGGFRLMASCGEIEESKVIAFLQDDGTVLDAAYRFAKNTMSYNISPPADKTVVIDPNIIWTTYYGGNLDEDINNGEMGVDKQGKVIITGSTNSTQYIASTGAVQVNYGGGYHDAFVAKFTLAGKLSWATFYGGADKDEGHSIVADPLKNIYVSGLTTSHTGISTVGSHQAAKGGGQDAFILKLNSSGVRLWATYFGGTTQDEILDIDCDALGNLYYGGYTVSPNNIATSGAYQESMNNAGGNNGDAFVGEFTPSGQWVWGSYFSGSLQDRAQGIAVGKNGTLFLQGTCESTSGFATAGTYQSVYGGGISDAFLAKWDTNGNFIWCSYYGGATEDHGRGVRTDQNNNAYIIGWTDSETGIATAGAVQPNWYEDYEVNGDRKPDGYLAKFTQDGAIVWGTYYGGSGKDQTFGLAVDQANQIVYTGGYTTSPENISTPGSFKQDYQPTSDGFLVKFTMGGSRIWGTYLGAADAEELHGMSLDQNGFLYLFLSTTGNSFSVTPDAYQTTSHGGEETLVIKFNVADACYDSYEPNNTSTASKLLKTFSDSTLYGYTAAITTATDADWYKIKLPAITNLKIELTDLPADYDLKLYKLNGQLLLSSIHSGTADEKIIYNNAPKATYLIEIPHSISAFNANSCYRLKPMTSNSPWLMKEGDQIFSFTQEKFQATIYPNPAIGEIYLKFTAATPSPVNCVLYNIVHQPVLSSSFDFEGGIQEVRLPLNNVSAGIYMLEINCNGEKITRKVIVQN